MGFLFALAVDFRSPVERTRDVVDYCTNMINWFFTEFFQEKRGTSFGNAISNGAIAIFASIDWTRYMYRLYTEGILRSFTFGVFLKITVSLGVFAYGLYVIILSIKTHKLVYLIGRIRWVTYLLVMFTPIVYNVIRMDFYTLLAIIVFFPLYYWFIEIFDRITPEPKTYRHS